MKSMNLTKLLSVWYSNTRKKSSTAKEAKPMDSMSEVQGRQVGALMKDFIDTFIEFSKNIKSEDVCRRADEETLSRLAKQGIPRNGRPLEKVYREMLRDVAYTR